MGNKKQPTDNSRRWFLSLLLPGNETPAANTEKIKMLTADGKLVEVDKDVFEKARKNQKASNREILQWMKNPSKENG